MAVLIVGSEKTFTDLRERLFTGRVSSANLQRAKAAIAAANPHADLGKLAPGTVLTIPDIPEIPDRGALSLDASVRDGVDSIAAQLTDGLAELFGDAKEQSRQSRAERKETLAAFDDPLVRRAAKGNQDLAAALQAAREALERDEAEAVVRLEGLAQSIDSWSAEIETLRKLAG
jgi:hypothetical protein